MKKIIVFFSIIIFTLLPSITYASRGLEINYPALPIPGGSIDIGAGSSIWHYFKYLSVLLILLTGLAAGVSLIYAGVIYLTTVGNPGQVQKALKRIKTSGLGILVVLSFYLLLGIINPYIVNNPYIANPNDNGGGGGSTKVEGDVCLENVQDKNDIFCFSANESSIDLKPDVQYKIKFNVDPTTFYGLYLYKETDFENPVAYYKNPPEQKYAAHNSNVQRISGGKIRSAVVDVYEPGVALYDEPCPDQNDLRHRPEKRVVKTQELDSMKVQCVRFRYTFYKERCASSRNNSCEHWKPDYQQGLLLTESRYVPRVNKEYDKTSGLVVPGLGKFSGSFIVPKGQKTHELYLDLNEEKLPASDSVNKAQTFRIASGNYDDYKNHYLVFYDKAGQNINTRRSDVKTFAIQGDIKNSTGEGVSSFYSHNNMAYYVSGEDGNPPMKEIYKDENTADRLMSMKIPPAQNYVVIFAEGEELEELGTSRVFTESFSNVVATTKAGRLFGSGKPNKLIIFISEE